MTKRIASFIPLLLLIAAMTGNGGDRAQNAGARPTLGSLGAPLQLHDASGLTTPENTARKSGHKHAVAAIVAGRALPDYVPVVAWVRQTVLAPRPESSPTGADSIRAPPASVLAL